MNPSIALAAAAPALGLAQVASAQETACEPVYAGHAASAFAPQPKAPLSPWITDGGNFEVNLRESAKTYRARLTPARSDQLLVRGYAGTLVFGKSHMWLRPAVENGGTV